MNRHWLMLGLLLPAPRARAQTPEAMPAYPWAVGESFRYSAKLGILNLGSASMEVAKIDTVRGFESFLFKFTLETHAPLYHANNALQSWSGTHDLISRRFHQDLEENGRIKQRYYDIYPDSGFIRQERKEGSWPTPTEPLDDAAFFYFIRSTALEMGKSYEFDRYFRKELNPVKVSVVKREELELPDGTKVSCLVLQPVVGDQGIFGPRADARLWLTDDARRIPVQIRSRLPFGTVTLRLTDMTLPSQSTTPAAQ